MKPLILICTADADFYLLLSHILEVDGFASVLADTIEETFLLAAEKQPEAAILDCQPDSFSGAEVCERLKQDPQTQDIPVVALIGAGAETQHVDLLKAGVDESFIRPVAPAKLLGFLQTNLAEHPLSDDASEGGKFLNYGDIEMSLVHYRVSRGGQDIHLGPIEFRLLHHLLQNPGQVFSRDELISAAWPENIYVELRTVDVHIGRLRRALATVEGTDVIRTVRSAGYALGGPVPEQPSR